MEQKDKIIKNLMNEADKEMGIYSHKDRRILRDFINLCIRTKDKSFIKSVCTDHLK